MNTIPSGCQTYPPHRTMLRTITNPLGTGQTLVALIAIGLTQVQAADWASWRGPTQNGVAYETGLPDSCKTCAGKALRRTIDADHLERTRFWDRSGRERRDGTGRAFALDLQTGKLVWDARFNVFLTDIPNSRVGWASLAGDPETGNIYAHGVQGMFLCFDRDGRQLWSRSLTELYGRISGYGGHAHSDCR